MAIIKEKKFKISSVIENLSQSGLPEGDTERTEITPDGFLKISDGEIVIMYSESTEGGKVVSDIIIADDTVSVIRRGAVVSDMVFSEGERHNSLYQVPPYSFDTEIYTATLPP